MAFTFTGAGGGVNGAVVGGGVVGGAVVVESVEGVVVGVPGVVVAGLVVGVVVGVDVDSGAAYSNRFGEFVPALVTLFMVADATRALAT